MYHTICDTYVNLKPRNAISNAIITINFEINEMTI